MVLPEALLRYIPIAANARVPGRAMVVVFLALALLAARALTAWRARSGHPTVVLTCVLALVGVDYLPAPFPLVEMDRPRIYETLRDRPETGAVCELPLGMADGFGETGRLDRRTLFYQTIHGRPTLGGFVARLPPSVVASTRADPLISAFLRLSAPGDDHEAAPALPDRVLSASLLQRDGIRFVMLNRETAPQALIDYVERVLPLTLVAQEGARSLYLTTSDR
jgi:hypothetical protein